MIIFPQFALQVSASIQHFGNDPKSGHYTAFIQSENKWLLANDDVVSKKERFITGLKNVNVLFFTKV